MWFRVVLKVCTNEKTYFVSCGCSRFLRCHAGGSLGGVAIPGRGGQFIRDWSTALIGQPGGAGGARGEGRGARVMGGMLQRCGVVLGCRVRRAAPS